MRTPNGNRKAHYVVVATKDDERFYFIADYPDSIMFPRDELILMCEKDDTLAYISYDYDSATSVLKNLGFKYKGHIP